MNPQARKEDEQLKRLAHYRRQDRVEALPLGAEMISFFKQSVAKRQTKVGKIAEVWGVLVPEHLSDHCALESYTRGTLSVLVDSSSHLYEMKQLLLSGLQQQLLMACKSAGLRKITLRAGRWYADADGQPKPQF